jgi:hypothetical protein
MKILGVREYKRNLIEAASTPNMQSMGSLRREDSNNRLMKGLLGNHKHSESMKFNTSPT